MSFEQIDISQLEGVVYDTFSGDRKLVSKYHVHGGSLEACVEHTMGSIRDVADKYRLGIYASEYGYAVFCGYLLYSFGIKKTKRTKENKADFASFVKTHSNSCLLWSKNERAIRFLESIGFTRGEEAEDDGKKYTQLFL